MSRWLKITVLTFVVTATMMVNSRGEITPDRNSAVHNSVIANLERQLTVRLKATTEDRKAYIRRLVRLVKDGKVELKLVLGLERVAIRRRAAFPFLFFEKAMKVEAGKRGVSVPTVKEYAAANTKIVR